ncbi:substrate-binding domain-containing protein [Sediminispirochaeta smaragdinae]|uniref:Periplasmic binding protein/LacI transcriptional regulator n=1 Tax=Sediminispirochaeta smaragdinae (strain DSM 11293 / JCM 15392 / SEBR 4228) TaxID=573413 RepID=E1R0Z8_SEDSS|nr:substrate-binding domain-containing protein [Sediminispirochaeta smaragdinae]ADK80247.1 periplasmic binding protein/LacI transcriptional regulator [Sediminispirochaeta smaragdinae DSM 11293]
MEKRFSMVLVLLSLLLTPIFANGSQESSSSQEGGKSYRIAFTMALRDQFLSTMENACLAEAKKEGVKVASQDAQQSSNAQLSQVQQFAAQDYDALIVNLVTTDNSQAVLSAAGDMPVVFVNRAPDVDLVKGKQTYVGSDEHKSGAFQAQALAKFFTERNVKTINYVLLQGTLGLQHTTLRTSSVKKGLEDAGFTLNQVYQDTAEYDRAKALNKMQQFIASGKKFDCVICNNDEMALGAIAAMKQAGLDPKEIPVVGIDATAAGLTAMENGELYATVFQDAKGQGEGALKAAMALASGQEIDTYIDIPFQLVDQSNYKNYMK